MDTATHDYDERVRRERERFAATLNVHDLPPIFHYWSNRYLRPMAEELGFSSPDDFFVKGILTAAASAPGEPVSIASLGSGNCDTEVRLAAALRGAGLSAFHIDCFELSSEMLERGQVLARDGGVSGHLDFHTADINDWVPSRSYAVVVANQILHHVIELERLYDRVLGAIGSRGAFLVSDMIGRNGHLRWPEALAIVRELWSELPAHYRYHLLLNRQEDEFLDWDCSVEGFEGIRAQEVLPLLCERFGFELFLAWGNVIDPFIDRGFGHHFDPEKEWDRAFIDRVHERDEGEILGGRITPTHMMAVLRGDRRVATRSRAGLTPEACIRRP